MADNVMSDGTATHAHAPASQAMGKLRLGIARLAERYPFHVAVLEQFRLQARPDLGTIGVAVDGDVLRLSFDPAFVLEQSADMIAAVALHEVHHVVLGHVTADPADFPDAWARTVAEETAANEYIVLPLPPGAITLESLRGLALPARESTRRRYDRLRRVRRADRLALQGAPGGGEAGPAGWGPSFRPIDDHGLWAEDPRPDPEKAEAVRREAIREALLAVGPDAVPVELRDAIEGQGIGRFPASGRSDRGGRGRGRLDWRRHLRRHVGRLLHVRPVFDRPPRRAPDLIGVWPARSRRPGQPRVMAAVDTSASMDDLLLEQVDAELARLARNFVVTVAEFDARVQRTYPYHRRPGEFRGRGGTSFVPILEPGFLRRHRPDLIIIFTDGHGPAPAAPPKTPVLWCLTPGGNRPADWGSVIWMEDAL
jgi:hypothetical protein